MNRKSLFTLKLFTIIFILFNFLSCKKDSADDQIPNVPVNFTIYLNLPQYVNLNNPGGYSLIAEYGYKGVIVYRKSFTEFVSYDLACPYDPTVSGAKLEIDSSGITMVDLHCGSKFSLDYGTILKGPATRPMKSYLTTYDSNSNSVSVTNY